MKTYIKKIGGGIIHLDPDDTENIEADAIYEIKLEVSKIKNMRKWGKNISYKTDKPII